MLRWTVIFLIIAVGALFFGFGGIAGAPVIKALSYVFILLFLLSLVFGQPQKAGTK